MGFYYDFVFEQPLTEGLVEVIEVHLQQFIRDRHAVKFISMMRENAKALFQHHHQYVLAEKAGKESSNILELVQMGDFFGFCPSLPVTSSEEVGVVKILEVEVFKQFIEGEELFVTRLLGTSQPTSYDLKILLKNYRSLIKKKDHRRLGVESSLFSFLNKFNHLGVAWHPKGLLLQKLLQQWGERVWGADHQLISTPSFSLLDPRSAESPPLSSFAFEDKEYALRWSMKQQHIDYLNQNEEGRMPRRVLEYATVFQRYSSSQRWGLFCACSYLSDQITISCTKEQILPELSLLLQAIDRIMGSFGFDAQWALICSPQKGRQAAQEREGIDLLRKVLMNATRFSLSPEVEEEKGVDGPRLELRIRDLLGRQWSASQLGISQSIANGKPTSGSIILSCRLWGSLDRFIALLIEKYEGALPFWLSPEQVRIISIGEANRLYAEEIYQLLASKGFRASYHRDDAKLSSQILKAERENIPYLLMVGEKEQKKQKVTIRPLNNKGQTETVDLTLFIEQISREAAFPV